jgi:phosphatidylglycerol:prolipoprotein diacylglycerol transferase
MPLGLILYPQIDPVMIHLGPVAIRWYGMAYMTGFVLAFFVLVRLARKGVLRMPAEWVSDLVGWLALGVVAGGRAGWWIFYHHHMDRVSSAPEPWWEPIAIWRGGMSFHGGFLGVLLALYLWSRGRKLSYANLADCLALVTPIGLFLGRLANFINGELYGRPTSVAWAMIFPSDPQQVPRHPSQLYEAFLEGIVLFAALWSIKAWKNRRDGQIAAAFVVLYAIFRFTVEFTREPDEQLGYIAFGWLTMGQLLSVALGLAGLIWGIWLRKGEPAKVLETPIEPPANPPQAPGPRGASARRDADKRAPTRGQ